MKNSTLFPLERNRYFYGKLLTVRDFELEQTYFNNKRRLINKAVIGSGVVCGLGVTQVDDFTLIVESGLAIDYLGREVVVEAPIVRKLQMIEGYDELQGASQAYLCMKYSETPTEAVNAVASASQSVQHNKVEESHYLYLDTDEPDIAAILSAAGYANVCLLYQSQEVTLAFSMPQAVLAGEEFTVRLLAMKSSLVAPLSFNLSFDSQFITDRNGGSHIEIEMKENPLEQKRVRVVEATLKAANLSGSMVDLADGPGLLTVELGDMKDAISVELQAQAFICENAEVLKNHLSVKDNLRARLNVEDLPLYLAKLQIIPAGASMLIGDIYSLPFDQRLQRNGTVEAGATQQSLNVTSEVEQLKYWQKPEAQAQLNHATNTLHFKFGIPSTQEYDYQTSSGVVDIPMTSGMRVNARYVSEEIPHNLGLGNVSITLAVEFETDDSEKAQFIGNREVFRGRSGGVPQVQTAAILYPEKGTFKVGVWLLDNVEGSIIRVRYYASKVTRDLNAVKMADAITIKITPEVQRIKVRERLHMKANVYGTNDRGVKWIVRDQNGGTIDQNGLYQAPDIQGTYEVVAESVINPEVKVSSFVIVEE